MSEDPVGLGIESVKVRKGKPPALVYIDDRALRFEGPGSWPDRAQVHAARPWHKQSGSSR